VVTSCDDCNESPDSLKDGGAKCLYVSLEEVSSMV
jgi:hypothetical protein